MGSSCCKSDEKPKRKVSYNEDETRYMYGEPIKYDPDFRGPNGKRSCTDIIFLSLFLVFIFCWIIIGAYAMINGNVEQLLVPKDSMGRKCGHEVDTKNKPYLLFFDLTTCIGPKVLLEGCNTPQVCVERCPDESFKVTKDNFENYKNKIVCETNYMRPTTYGEFEESTCAKWYLKSEPVFKRCIYSEFPAKWVGLTEDRSHVLKDRVSVAISWLSLSVQNTVAQITENKKAQEIITLVTQDLQDSWWKILLGLLGAMVLCLIYILLMRYIAGIMVWISIVGVIVILSVGVYISAMKYKSLKDYTSTNQDTQSIWEQRDVWLAILIIVSILLGVVLLLLLFLRKRILIAIALIKEASKAVGSITSSLFFPILPWVLQLGFLVYAVAVGLSLSSIGTPSYQIRGITKDCVCSTYTNGALCKMDEIEYACSSIRKSVFCKNLTCSLASIEKPAFIQAFHAYNIIGGFWVVFFMSAFGEMVLAATFATWYWTFRKSDVPYFTLTKGFLVTVRYHVGTLAFGSLIITICRLIRVVIEYIDHKLKKYDNGFITAMMCCCKCFFWCLEKFLKFINKNAYIMCAIHGRNFCMSAKDAFNLLMRNLVRVFVVDKVTDTLLFLAKLLVTAMVSVVAYTAFTNGDFDVVDSSNLHYVLVPVISIAIGTYLICCIFFGVYSMAVDTLFLCFLEDCERNDGSPDKPYFMSKELMKILGKKNKRV